MTEIINEEEFSSPLPPFLPPFLPSSFLPSSLLLRFFVSKIEPPMPGGPCQFKNGSKEGNGNKLCAEGRPPCDGLRDHVWPMGWCRHCI